MRIRSLIPCLVVLTVVGCGPGRNDKITPPPESPSSPNAGPAQAAPAIRQVLKSSSYICGKCEEDANFFRNNFGENEKVARQAKSLKAIDTTQCPKDFKDAFLAHIQALEKLDLALTSNPAVANLWDNLRISAAPAVKEARESVLKTWQTVEQIATAHGVAMHELQ